MPERAWTSLFPPTDTNDDSAKPRMATKRKPRKKKTRCPSDNKTALDDGFTLVKSKQERLREKKNKPKVNQPKIILKRIVAKPKAAVTTPIHSQKTVIPKLTRPKPVAVSTPTNTRPAVAMTTRPPDTPTDTLLAVTKTFRSAFTPVKSTTDSKLVPVEAESVAWPKLVGEQLPLNPKEQNRVKANPAAPIKRKIPVRCSRNPSMEARLPIYFPAAVWIPPPCCCCCYRICAYRRLVPQTFQPPPRPPPPSPCTIDWQGKTLHTTALEHHEPLTDSDSEATSADGTPPTRSPSRAILYQPRDLYPYVDETTPHPSRHWLSISESPTWEVALGDAWWTTGTTGETPSSMPTTSTVDTTVSEQDDSSWCDDNDMPVMESLLRNIIE